MKFKISVNDRDVQMLRKLKHFYIKSSLVKRRKKRNIDIPYRRPTHHKLWHGFVIAILTTQQRLTPDNPIGRACRRLPKFLRLSEMKNTTLQVLRRNMRNHGLTRMLPTVSDRLFSIYKYLENGGWDNLENDILKPLFHFRLKKARWCNKAILAEKLAADKLASNGDLKGIGPKQARNFLQHLGLIRFETPLDSRVLNYLEKTSPKMPLAQNLFQDKDYYNFVMSAFQVMCQRAHLFPCIADRIIFDYMDSSRKQ